MVDEEFIRQSRLVRSENAIVTSMYNDAFAVPIVTLGQSLNRVNSTARRILFYIPGQVSERALCVASASGFEPYAVERIEPPQDGGVHDHFKDQYTKLTIWRFGELGLKAVVYLDADTVVRRNFDELFLLPFNFAAVPDVYIDDPGFTVAFNAGVLFVRPSSAAYNNLVRHIETAKYPHFEAEQAYLNVFYGPDAVRLPYAYNGNMAIKKRNPELWAGIKHELRLIHFTLVKPFWRNTYTDMGLDDMHRNAQMRAEEWGALWKDEILEWDRMWKETEDLYRHEFSRCGTKHRDVKVSAFP
ncbi:nucleotide-diphospho-sugar transferase [Daedaleopsis nitida]|nr:nucleotide-diphospho-sugar transferase [Daedaleopsis nitida]